MNRKYVIGGIIVVVVLAVVIGATLYNGGGPAPGDTSVDNSGGTIEDVPTETKTETVSGTGGTDTTAGPPFLFTVDSIEECGTTCRDVTVTLTNNQNETATNVIVYTSIFAGEDNTDTSGLVWEGKHEVGTLASGASITTTERVELSLQDALKIDQNDGWITIQTTVDSDETRVTFKDSDQVA